MIYITGDKHGDFNFLPDFCAKERTTKKDILIVLGDAGINYYKDSRDEMRKRLISLCPITLFCIHGNHEARPATIPSYKLKDFHKGKAYNEDRYPNIFFAKDGEIYDFNKLSCIAIGGAYSVDKQYRLIRGFQWFEDEQPDEETKTHVEEVLKNNKVDVVLTHTVPVDYEPVDAFIPGLDQSKVDKTTELWLRKIEQSLDYKWWYAGHYHIERVNEKVQIMYNNIEKFKTKKDLT